MQSNLKFTYDPNKKLTLQSFEEAVIYLNELAIAMYNQAVEEDRVDELFRDLENNPDLKLIYNALAKIDL